MSYKDHLSASQEQAHNQNIATKILRDLSLLRATIEEDTSNSRRWIWELIQNAKDVSFENGVKIKIQISSKNEFTFSHNGKTFSANNIRYLIEQISTKDQDNDDNGKRRTTGKFGTGFLTTHLLSEVAIVEGIVKEDCLPYKKFKVSLDRKGYTNLEIINSVNNSRAILNRIDDLPDYNSFNPDEFNTHFTYPISDEIGLKVLNDGMKDLKTSIGFTLCISDKIEKVILDTDIIYQKEETVIPVVANGEIRKIIVQNHNEKSALHYLVLWKNLTSILLPINVSESNEIEILNIDNAVPTLFCEFPLIGSSSFSFPVVINNPNFNPTEPRDGIVLTTTQRQNPLSDQNKQYILEGLELYKQLVDLSIVNNWKNLHLLAKIQRADELPNWISKNWYDNEILSKVRTYIGRKNIVSTTANTLEPLLDLFGKPHILIPRSSKDKIKDKLWNKGRDLFPNKIPIQEHISFWSKYGWDACGKFNLSRLCKEIENHGDLEKLGVELIFIDPIEWLKSIYDILSTDEYNYDRLINNYNLFPNQNGLFIKLNEIKIESEVIPEIFKDILLGLENDVRSSLLDTKITFEDSERTKINEADIIKLIKMEVNTKSQDRTIAKRYRKPFNDLLLYFRENEKDARTKFPLLFKNKYLLFDEDEMIENINKIEKVNILLDEFNISSIDELKIALNQVKSNEVNSQTLLPLTSEIISSLGITNIDDWKLAMEDKDLATLFQHQSIPAPEMFVLANAYIARANNNIKTYLATLNDYDLSDAYFTANTVLGGVKKRGKLIDVVCRPAYKNEVIIYYQAERDVLDYQDSELWVETSNAVKRISLGYILKSSKIHKFPI